MIYIMLLVLILCSCTQNANIPSATSEPRTSSLSALPDVNTPRPLSTPLITQTPQSGRRVSEDSTLLSKFKTALIDKEPNRLSNIKLASKTINGYIIKKGEEFSFNNVLGERTEEKGYKEATVLVGEEHTSGIGGGVCQVATTLYNAAQKGKLEITEHHTHKLEVAYAPEGTDATVNYDNLDLKFKNNTGTDIKICSSVNKRSVYVELRKI